MKHDHGGGTDRHSIHRRDEAAGHGHGAHRRRHHHDDARDGGAHRDGPGGDHRGGGHPFGHRGGRHGGGGRRGGRLFDHGELRLLVLAMIADRPRHGYELIKAIEERMGGSYSPSPGVIYPMLAWLEDMGYALVEAGPGGRKLYRLTPEGEGHVADNRAAVDALFARIGEGGVRDAVPAPVTRALENLKLALRLRFRQGPLDRDAAEQIAAALDAAAQAVERVR